MIVSHPAKFFFYKEKKENILVHRKSVTKDLIGWHYWSKTNNIGIKVAGVTTCEA